MPQFFKISIQFLFCLTISSLAHAAIVTDQDGVMEDGRIGEISETGFQFFGDRFVFLEYYRVVDIIVDPALTGVERDKETAAVKKVSLLLDKEKTLESKLGGQVRQWLKEGNFKELDNKAVELNRISARWPTGRWKIYSFYQSVTSDIGSRDVAAFNQRLAQVNAWVKARPNSTTAKISRMHGLTDLAWAYRGVGYSNTVTEDTYDLFKKTLKEVIDIGATLRKVNTTDLMFYNYLINAENAYGAKKSLLIELAKESSDVNPIFYLPYIRTLTGLLPKWGGRRGEVEKFSRWAYQLVDNQSPEVIFQIHRALSHSIEDEVYVNMDFDWVTIQIGFENFRKRYHANDSDLHLMAKFASLHGDKAAARNYFAQTDGSWNYLSEQVWGSEAKLDRFIEWANTEDNPKYKQIIDTFLTGNLKVFSVLLESLMGAKEVFLEKDIFGNTLLHNLARANTPKYLDKVSSIGINLNTYNDNGYTALHLAAASGYRKNVEILIKNGADIFAILENQKSNAAHIAAENGFTEALSVLLDKEPSLISSRGNNGSPPIHLAAWNGYLETVKFLAKRRKNEINVQDDYLYTPLFYAIDRGHENIAKYLIDKGADLTLKNNNGHTVLSYARAKGFDQIAVYLKRVGAPDAQVVDNSEKLSKAQEIYELSGQYFNKSDYEKAKEIYFKALEYYPEYYLAYAGLAQVAFDFEKDYLQADKYYDQSIKLNPAYVENYYWKGRVNYELNKPEVYTPLFIKYIELAPNTYNSQDLKKNWSHLLKNDKPLIEDVDTTPTFIQFIRANTNIIAAVLAILVLLLILIRRRRQPY